MNDYSSPAEQQYFSDIGSRVRDIEEKHKLLKERTLLIGQSLVEERQETFAQMQELKKIVLKLQEENLKIKELMQRAMEQLSAMARKEELMILQRQFDIFKPHLN